MADPDTRDVVFNMFFGLTVDILDCKFSTRILDKNGNISADLADNE